MIDDKSSFFFSTTLHSFAASIFAKLSLSNEAPSQPRQLQGDRRVERMGALQLPEWIHCKIFIWWLAAPREKILVRPGYFPSCSNLLFSSEPSLHPSAPGFSHVRNDSGDPSGLTYAMHQRGIRVLEQNLKFAHDPGVQGLATAPTQCKSPFHCANLGPVRITLQRLGNNSLPRSFQVPPTFKTFQK